MRAWCLAREDLRSATLLSLLAYAGPRPESEALPLRWEAIRKRTILFRATKRGVAHERATRLLAPLAADLDKWRKASGSPPDSGVVIPNRTKEPWADYDWDNWRERTFRPAAAGGRFLIERSPLSGTAPTPDLVTPGWASPNREYPSRRRRWKPVASCKLHSRRL
jgi:hypothetical protein